MITFELTQEELDVIGFAVKSRLQKIEDKLANYNPDPELFKLACSNDSEFQALLSVVRKMNLND